MRPIDHERLERMIADHGLYPVIIAVADASEKRAKHIQSVTENPTEGAALEQAAKRLRSIFGPRLAHSLRIGTGYSSR